MRGFRIGRGWLQGKKRLGNPSVCKLHGLIKAFFGVVYFFFKTVRLLMRFNHAVQIGCAHHAKLGLLDLTILKNH